MEYPVCYQLGAGGEMNGGTCMCYCNEWTFPCFFVFVFMLLLVADAAAAGAADGCADKKSKIARIYLYVLYCTYVPTVARIKKKKEHRNMKNEIFRRSVKTERERKGRESG